MCTTPIRRHHRARLIRKRYKLALELERWSMKYEGAMPDGRWSSGFATADWLARERPRMGDLPIGRRCSCEMCKGPRYERPVDRAWRDPLRWDDC